MASAEVWYGATRITWLRVSAWQAAVDRKQELVEKAYELAKGEVEIRRSTALEVIVIVLILIELVAAFRGGH